MTGPSGMDSGHPVGRAGARAAPRLEERAVCPLQREGRRGGGQLAEPQKPRARSQGRALFRGRCAGLGASPRSWKEKVSLLQKPA